MILSNIFKQCRLCTVLLVLLIVVLSACASLKYSENREDTLSSDEASPGAVQAEPESETETTDLPETIRAGTTSPNSDKKTEEVSVSDEELNPTESEEAPERTYINELIGAYLGKSATEIVSKTGYQASYIKIGDRESLILYDGGLDIRSLVFSQSVWNEDSQCIGIYVSKPSVRGYPTLFESMFRIKEIFGKAATWRESENEWYPYYLYDFNDNTEVKFFTDDDGVLLQDGDLLIKYADADIYRKPLTDAYEDALLDAELLTRPEWSTVSKYMSYLGKTWSEIKKDYPETAYNEEYWYGVDPKTGIMFVLPIDGTCDELFVPIEMLFSEINRTVSRKEFEEILNANHKWYVDESTFYAYKFPGINIFISSKLDGTVLEDTLVEIELR